LIFLNLATEEEIIAIANQFQSGKAASYDTIPKSTIKQSINFISSLLAHLLTWCPFSKMVTKLFFNHMPVFILAYFSTFL